ncbi:interferon-induced protein with tetratricopeptide repeats 5 isoform X2 [Triplophysa dalaica]|uniref:interferon-induced protein with tetratricopeptide repeats 5 isoform X2 n=1 Tax=Triplophysa dalaica TaxID=1582913 RepID=UPI0024DF6736|nr:interferon-induced protein with tetratricopeptide repeats 5 isoform X2 [Triplophysa dalaica]
MSYEDILKTRLVQQECHFTWSLREGDFAVSDLLIRLDEQIELESGKARVTRAYSSLGFIYYLLCKQPEALNYLQKSVQLAKEYYKEKSDEILIVTYGDLAWLHYHMKEFSICEDYLRLLERIHGTFSEGFNYTTPLEVLREKGWTFLKFSKKYYNGAKECFRQALEINPDDSDLNTGYAITLYRTTWPPEPQDSPTMKQLQRAVNLDPDDAVLLVLLALRMINIKDDEKAHDIAVYLVICALLKSSENTHVIRYAAQFFRQLGPLDDAISLLEKALKDTPNSAFLHHQLARCYTTKNQNLRNQNPKCNHYLYRCIYHLEKAIALKPFFIVAIADLALQYGRQGIHSKADRIFEEAFKMANMKNEHQQMVYCKYGQYQRHQKSEEKAIYNFMQGLRLQPKSSEGKLCETNLRRICDVRIRKLKNPHDSKACGIHGFIHEVKGEKLQAAEHYKRALTKGLAEGESCLLTEMRIWLMSLKEADKKSVPRLIFDRGTYEEGLGSGGIKILKGTMDRKIVNLFEIDISNIKRILRWEQQALNPGPHAVILAVPLDHGEFTDKTKEIVKDFEFLGEKFWSHVIVVFTEGDSSIDKYHGTQKIVLQWLLEKCGRRYYISGIAPCNVEMREVSKMIQEIIRCNNSMHLLLPEMADGDAQFLSEAFVGVDIKNDDLVTPEIIDQEGQTIYRVSCFHAGWFHCKFTNLGFNMKGAGEVLYSTFLQKSSNPIPANCYPAGPLYEIRCVQGELCELRLPHCETSIEDGIHSMSVIHYSDDLVELLKPQNITSTHMTVSIPGTSRFRLTRILNWFKEIIHCHAIPLYLQIPHKLLVFLQPRNVNPRDVAEYYENSKLIKTTCECHLEYNCKYSMSCEPLEKLGPSVNLDIEIQPTEHRFSCSFKKRDYYSPAFEIELPENVMKVKLSLKKATQEKAVWESKININGVSFLKGKRSEIIKRVVNIDAILDGFADDISLEQLNNIRVKKTPHAKTRDIFILLDSMPTLNQKFFTLLKLNEPQLLKDLMPNTSTGNSS